MKLFLYSICTHYWCKGHTFITQAINLFLSYITPEKFYIEPKNNDELLIIDRASEVLTLQRNAGQIPSVSTRQDFCGLLGSITLLAGPYLVIATQRDLIG